VDGKWKWVDDAVLLRSLFYKLGKWCRRWCW